MPFQKQNVRIERILKIVKRLYAQEVLVVDNLALDYGFSKKTICRDLEKIAFFLPLEKAKGVYSLQPLKMDNFLTHFEKKDSKPPEHLFELLHTSIEEGCKVKFVYKKRDDITTRVVSPIQFYRERLRYYLIAKDDKDALMKTFYFGKISNLELLREVVVTLTKKEIEDARNKQSVWSDSKNDEFLVKIYVKSEVAEYFLDGEMHHSQTIVDEHYDGGLEIDYRITHYMEILPKIKAYIPYLFVLEPKWLHDKLMDELKFYVDKDSEMDI